VRVNLVGAIGLEPMTACL